MIWGLAAQGFRGIYYGPFLSLKDGDMALSV